MSGGGLKVGELYVSVTASIGEALKSLSQLVDKVEEVADEIEENMSKAAAALGDFSDGLLTVSALAAAAVAGAAETSGKASDELERLKKSVLLLSREVGELFLPLVREMTAWVKTAIATWRGLDAGLKANIVTAVKYAAVIGVASKALERSIIFTKSFAEGTVALIRIGKMVAPLVVSAFTSMAAASMRAFLAFQWTMRADIGAAFTSMASGVRGLGPALKALPGSIAGMGKSFLAILPQIGAVLLPLLAVAAAVGGIVLFAGSLYKSWDNLTYLFRESTADIVEDMRKLGEKAADFFGSLMQGVKNFISDLATAMLDAVFTRVKQVASFMESVARKLGRDALADNLAQIQNLSADAFMGKIKDEAAQIVDVIAETGGKAGKAISDATKDVREGVAYGLKHSMEGAQQLGTYLAKALHLDELMALKDKLFGAVPKVGDGSSVELPKDWEAEVGKPDTSVGLTSSIRALASGKDPIMKAHLDMLRGNAKAAAEAMQAAMEAMRAAAAALKSKLASRMGEIMDIMDSAGQGFAAGGIWGAIIAVVLDLLTRSEQFKGVIEMVNTIIQMISDTLGKVLGSLAPVIAAILSTDMQGIQALSPALEAIGEMLGGLAPLFMLVGQMLAPLFHLLGAALEHIMPPIQFLVDVALRTLFEVLKGAGTIIMGIVLGIREAWNIVIGAIQSVLRAISEFEILGGRPFEFLAEWANGLEGAKTDTSGLRTAMDELNAATYDALGAKAKETAAAYAAAAALDKATASLTNVPSSWRYALRSVESQNARGPLPQPTSQPPGSGTGAPPSSPAAPAQPSAPAAPLVDTININVQDEYAGMSALQEKLDEMAYRARGSRGRGRYAEVP